MKNIIERMEEEKTAEKIARFRINQQLPYEQKVAYAAKRSEEFYLECQRRGLSCHVSVGGLDSITLYLFLNQYLHLGIPGISVSHLEDKSIQAVHKQLGIESLRPISRADGKPWNKAAILQEFGFPVLSKETAGKIELLQHPTPQNATVRHAIITGETGKYGGYRKGTRMKLAQKWLELFAGYENESEGVDYKKDVRIRFLDGTIIRVGYPKGGKAIWWIEVEKQGTAKQVLTICDNEDADVYSDIFEIDSEIKSHSVIKQKYPDRH